MKNKDYQEYNKIFDEDSCFSIEDLQKIDKDFQVINSGFSGDTAFQEFLRLSTNISLCPFLKR